MFSRIKLCWRSRISEIPSVSYCKESPDVPNRQTYSKVFFDATVQDLLKKVTNIDLEIVFRPRGPRIGNVRKYKLVTTEELQKQMDRAKKRADFVMQIPPLITPKVREVKILHEDPALDGYDIHHSKLVCTDISHKVFDERRMIVVREPNGVLRTASDSERVRVNQIYFPTPGRELELPKMFEDENLQFVLDREEYEFILDRSCSQFQPEDPMFHKVIELTFERIYEKCHFQKLLSTRHYGCLVFYLVTHKKLDKLLIDVINAERIEDAFNLVKLYHIVHPDCKSAGLSAENQEMENLKNYIKVDATEKDVLELALQNYLQNAERKKNIETGIREAHGLS